MKRYCRDFQIWKNWDRCHFVSLYCWVKDEEEMLTLSLRMEVDSV
jgi:hypothetical protein